MKLASLIPILFVFMSCSPQKEEYLLNDEFNENIHGWVEETTESHQTELLDGKLVVMSLDTAASFSSNGPRDKSIFWSLPRSWEFTTAMEVIDGGPEAGFGILLYSASLNYQFSINRKGELLISEYDYNKQADNVIVEKTIPDFSLNYNTPAKIRLIVRGESFEFFLDDKKQAEGSFRAKSWETLRLFAKAGGTGIKSDYYRFKAI